MYFAIGQPRISVFCAYGVENNRRLTVHEENTMRGMFSLLKFNFFFFMWVHVVNLRKSVRRGVTRLPGGRGSCRAVCASRRSRVHGSAGASPSRWSFARHVVRGFTARQEPRPPGGRLRVTSFAGSRLGRSLARLALPLVSNSAIQKYPSCFFFSIDAAES
jgi:hypothetical protein